MASFQWSRREFLKAAGVWAGGGLLQPLFPLIAAGDTIEKAYPEQLRSIEAYTKGKVKPGMIIGKDNAELVKDIACDGLMTELQRGARIKITETTLDPTALQPIYWYDATLRNKGRAVLDSKGQLLTNDGSPWIGGSPFPEAKNALEHVWNHTINYDRYDDWNLLGQEVHVDTNGTVVKKYTTTFRKIQTSGRLVVDPKPVLPDYKNELVRNILHFHGPFDVTGVQACTTIYYDATRMPDTYIYAPALRRTRRVPSSQRFEPAAPYVVLFITDLNCFNDPTLTWTWTEVGRRPLLAPSPANRGFFAEPTPGPDSYTWVMSDEKWGRSSWEMRPEMIILDGVPHLEGANYSKKRLFVDAVYQRSQMAEAYDMAGKLWKFLFIPEMSDSGQPDGAGHPLHGASAGICFIDQQKDYHSNVYFPKHRGSELDTKNIGMKVGDYMTPAAMLRNALR